MQKYYIKYLVINTGSERSTVIQAGSRQAAAVLAACQDAQFLVLTSIVRL